MSKILLLTLLLSCFLSKADIKKVESLYRASQGSSSVEAMVSELVKSGYSFTAVPWMKEYLVSRSGGLGSAAEASLESMIDKTGIQLFEKIPSKFLQNSKSSYMRYILAKQEFSRGNFEQSIKYLVSVSPNHSIYPFILNLKASAYYMLGSYENALSYYEECKQFGKKNASKQLEINQESCQAGIARSHFATKNYKKANDAYSTISKNSYIWPELLFEEAWNSYYMKDYNRSLGKVVSYNAPVLNNIFKPEIYSLQAVSYLKLCHYDEANRIADDFTKNYDKPSELLKSYILSRKNDYRYYYKLIANFERNPHLSNQLFYQVLSSISSGPVFSELKKSLNEASDERARLSKEGLGAFYNVLRSNIQNTILDLQQLIGEYVREELVQSYREIYKANQGMSFVRLDILNNKKQQLYGNENQDKKGDVKNLKKQKYQYFWNFNGEFWADELGDYVFALKSKCEA